MIIVNKAMFAPIRFFIVNGKAYTADVTEFSTDGYDNPFAVFSSSELPSSYDSVGLSADGVTSICTIAVQEPSEKLDICVVANGTFTKGDNQLCRAMLGLLELDVNTLTLGFGTTNATTRFMDTTVKRVNGRVVLQGSGVKRTSTAVTVNINKRAKLAIKVTSATQPSVLELSAGFNKISYLPESIIDTGAASRFRPTRLAASLVSSVNVSGVKVQSYANNVCVQTANGLSVYDSDTLALKRAVDLCAVSDCYLIGERVFALCEGKVVIVQGETVTTTDIHCDSFAVGYSALPFTEVCENSTVYIAAKSFGKFDIYEHSAVGVKIIASGLSGTSAHSVSGGVAVVNQGRAVFYPQSLQLDGQFNVVTSASGDLLCASMQYKDTFSNASCTVANSFADNGIIVSDKALYSFDGSLVKIADVGETVIAVSKTDKYLFALSQGKLYKFNYAVSASQLWTDNATAISVRTTTKPKLNNTAVLPVTVVL